MKKNVLVAVVLAAFTCVSVFAGGNADKKGGRVVLYSSMTENDIGNLTNLFEAKYPGYTIEVVNGSAGELTARIRAEKSNPQGDLMWGGLGNSDGMANADLFEPYLTEYEPDILDGYKSNNGFYNLDHLSTVVFCVNTDLEKELGLSIKGYKDLLNPKLKGKIVLSNPAASSAAWNNVCNIMSVYGNDSKESWDYIENLIKNDLVVVNSSSVCFKSVQTGEYVVGLTYEDGASTLLKSGATNIKMVYPAEGTSASAFGCAMIKGCKNPEGAKLLINFLMSPEGETELGNALQTLRLTNSKATYTSKYLPDSKDVKWVKRDVEYLTKNKKAILEKWNTIYTTYHK